MQVILIYLPLPNVLTDPTPTVPRPGASGFQMRKFVSPAGYGLEGRIRYPFCLDPHTFQSV